MEIGKKIKARRIELNLTQAQLSEKLHVSRPTISNWEIGRNYPDIQMIVELSNCLDISIDTLLKGDEIVVTHITNDTRLRKKQTKYIIGLVTLLILLLSYLSYNYVINYEKWLTDPKQIKTIAITDKRVNIEFELPPYLTFSGFATPGKFKDDKTLELFVSASFNYQFHQNNKVSIHLSPNLFPNEVKAVQIKKYNTDTIIKSQTK